VSRVKVVPLDGVRLTDETAVGSKAASLVRLKQLGLAVPAGFCVTERVFREHLETNGITGRIESALEKLHSASPEQGKAILLGIRQAIIKAPLARENRREIENHYHKLGPRRVAVRSSATAEDLPKHSFAGQYDTFLGVDNFEDCIEAVKKCWASLWTERAYYYRKKNGFDHLKVNMAVIVQSLIRSRASGVIFTADPVTGQTGSMVIEACFGFGEALVSGKVTPDRFVVDKSNLQLLSQTISEKKVECVLDTNGVVKEKTVPNERSLACCLDKKQVKRLAKLAKKVETKFGCPQDIEWSLSENKIYFLQSRPITVIPPEMSWEDRQIWSSLPAKEVMPDVVTPATLSMVDAMLAEFLDPVFRVLCIDRRDHRPYGLVAGRVYFNANIWGAVIRLLPGVRDYDFKKTAGSHKELIEMLERFDNTAIEDLANIKFHRLRFLFKLPLVIIGTLFNTPKKGRRILAKIDAANKEWSHLDVAGLSTEQIPIYYQDLVVDLRRWLGKVLHMLSVFAALPILDALCTKWLQEDSSCTGRLLAGLGDMTDAVAGLDLWRLALTANETDDAKDLILSNQNWRDIEPTLSQSDSGRTFLKKWRDFMDRHGHHCRGELELYNQRWSETPDYILKLVRSHITQIDKIDPIQNFANCAKQRQQLEQQCRRRLKNPLKRIIFNHLLVRSQYGSVFRENVKSEVIKLLTTTRKMLVELGKRLHTKGILKNQDDAFFLRLEEIPSVVQGKADFDIRQVIEARRARHEKNKSITPPDVVFGKFDPDKFTPGLTDEQTKVLNGLAVSPGVVSGKARVILRADTEEQLLAGEILVAPFTDPGWTPYFVPAAAIVMDMGGLLSHGSIIAREYGIPAVVNVGPGTRIIKTGQTIEVDGNTGTVRIIQ